MSILQILVLAGFVLGILGAIKSKYDEEHSELVLRKLGGVPTFESWTNIPQWSIGLKIMASGICMWLLGLILIGVTN